MSSESRPRRFRPQHAKPGELRAYYGRAEGVGPDVCFANGPGTDRADRRLLHDALACKRPDVDIVSGWQRQNPSLLDELERRGYDLTTLRFSVRKKADSPPAGSADER
jgi:hypothetical protein